MTLGERSDLELLSDVEELVGSHRAITAKLVAHLAEIEQRRLHLLAGFSSMFDFCQQKLGMSEGEAFRRILAARLGLRFPEIYPMLASGRVNLSTLELVREWLTEDNHEELLAAVVGKSKREVQAVLASRFPRPDRPSRVRERSRIEPLSEGRLLVEFTASEDLCRKLERCLDLMNHANPSRDLGVAVGRAVDLLLTELERKRLGKTRHSRPGESAREGARPSETNGPAVTNAVRREVYGRDGLQCTFVAEDGRRCDARNFLELDHIEPKAMGGSNAAENLRVRCRAHNQLWAEQTFGRGRVDRARHFRQKKSTRREPESVTATTMPAAVEQVPAGASVTLEKVRATLRSMGFRDAEARQAVAVVVRKHTASESITLEQALREALTATAAA